MKANPKSSFKPKRPIETLWRWPLRLTPKKFESGHGFLVRFAAQYNCTPDRVVRALGGLSRDHQLHVPSEVKRLSIVAGLSEEQARLLFITHPVRHQRGYHQSTFLGKTFFRSEFEDGRRRVCPMCLIADPFDRAIWRLKCVTSCVEHRIDLVDRCPDCERILNWQVQDVCLCQCGYDLRVACDHLRRKPKPTNEERAGKLIVDLLTDKAGYLPAGLANIPPIDFCIIMHDLSTRFEPPGLRRKFNPLHAWNGLRDLQHDRQKLIIDLVAVAEGRYRIAWREGQLRAMRDTLIGLQRDQVGSDVRSLLIEVFRRVETRQMTDALEAA